jgi:hypothetical protein
MVRGSLQVTIPRAHGYSKVARSAESAIARTSLVCSLLRPDSPYCLSAIKMRKGVCPLSLPSLVRTGTSYRARRPPRFYHRLRRRRVSLPAYVPPLLHATSRQVQVNMWHLI